MQAGVKAAKALHEVHHPVLKLVRDAHFVLIGTRRDYRKRGVASALIGHALRAAADQATTAPVRTRTRLTGPACSSEPGSPPRIRYVRWALQPVR
ncbi:N-acetyltransferase [Kibdelosporangium phytohabitans]|uniref:Uncharacterized protein n=1 Tax=Kibdelosporangium phytohabitans TaxID=860235 RepID=A0A0N9HTS7_9PSEU|nr:N-acetyltransferase [Kibdelosporangium phytohabitans]ALG10634.1 hypothetical protein AOZ06_30395 [Kibdelosporangium phytohabitans]MBE1461753.1 GNAT superfamily N-acetyltransferase [Kibdelosporangium phytohabitans]